MTRFNVSTGRAGTQSRLSAKSSGRTPRPPHGSQAAAVSSTSAALAGLSPVPTLVSQPPASLVCAASSSNPAPAAVCTASSGDGLVEYILKGPLLTTCGITPESVQAKAGEWERLGRRLAVQLEFEHDHMDPIQRLRIYHYYLPVYWWVAGQLELHRSQGNTTALMLGISAPQGCGKTTIVEQLEQLFNWLQVPAASVSIDDFYLTHADQNALAAANPTNRLLQMRGNAGTHDLALGARTLKELRELRQPGAKAAVPRYNKSAFGGKGDRADPSSWPEVKAPLQVVFFEGWMSGFAPLPEPEVAEGVAAGRLDPAIGQVNALLGAYRAAWDELVDSWLVVRIGDPQWVFKWRLQAEERMKAGGKAGMSAEQIADFVSRFIPAYTAFLPGLYARGPTTARAGRTLIIEVDQDRSPVAQQPKPVV